MKISIPVANELITVVDTNVIDTTLFFDNTQQVSIPYGQEFQYNNYIYRNTLETYFPTTYNAIISPPYEIGDIVFKDSLVQRVIQTEGEGPLAPNDASYTLDTDWDHKNWTGEYMKVRDIPAWHEGDYYSSSAHATTEYLTEVQYSYNGLKLYETDSGSQTIKQYTLNTAWDIQDKSYDGEIDILALTGYYGADNICFSGGTNGGLYLFVSTINVDAYIHRLTLTVEWDILSSISAIQDVLMETHVDGIISGITFKPDGSKFYITQHGNSYYPYATKVYEFGLSTNWSLTSTLTKNFEWNIGNWAYLWQTPRFSSDGLTLWVAEPSYSKKVKEYTLSVAWDLSSTKTLADTVSLDGVGANSIAWGNDGKYLLVSQASTNNMVRLTCPDIGGYNLSTTYHSIFPISYSRLPDVSYSISFDQTENKYEMVFNLTDLGIVYTWMNTYTSLTQDSIITDAVIYSNGEGGEAFAAKTMVINDDAVYIRTNTGTLLTDIITDYETAVVVDPAELKGFSFITPTNPYKPFDAKNYTKAERGEEMTYIISTPKKFDTVALGKVLADDIYLEFRDPLGEVVTTVDSLILTSRDTLGNLDSTDTTVIYYSDTIMEAGSSIYLKLSATSIELGTLLLGVSANAGFTDLTLKNDYKDYSVFEYDEWGNADYTERAKVSRYSGSVDVFIEDYDMTDRLMTSLGKNLVIVNGSDSNSAATPSTSIFAATQKIGRFLSFSQKTLIKDNDMDRVANYTFTLEEIV